MSKTFNTVVVSRRLQGFVIAVLVLGCDANSGTSAETPDVRSGLDSELSDATIANVVSTCSQGSDMERCELADCLEFAVQQGGLRTTNRCDTTIFLPEWSSTSENEMRTWSATDLSGLPVILNPTNLFSCIDPGPPCPPYRELEPGEHLSIPFPFPIYLQPENRRCAEEPVSFEEVGEDEVLVLTLSLPLPTSIPPTEPEPVCYETHCPRYSVKWEEIGMPRCSSIPNQVQFPNLLTVTEAEDK